MHESEIVEWELTVTATERGEYDIGGRVALCLPGDSVSWNGSMMRAAWDSIHGGRFTPGWFSLLTGVSVLAPGLGDPVLRWRSRVETVTGWAETRPNDA